MDSAALAEFEEQLESIKDPKHREWILLMKDKMDELVATIEMEGWKEADTKKGGYTVYTIFDEETGIKKVLGTGPLDFSVDQILDIIGDYSKRGLYDKMFVEGRVIEELGMNTRLEYQRMSAGPLISDRDFVMVTRLARFPSGRAVWVA